MSPDTIVLAIASAARPTGIAVVYALLSAPDPRRSLLAYILAGFIWSVGIGFIVVSVLHGVSFEAGTATSAVNVLGGVAALGFAAGLATGRIWSQPRAAPEQPALVRRLRDPSFAVAAGAGVATHLPGLFYLLGLNTIVATDPGFADGLVDVLVFNGIWFVTPVASLVFSTRRPEATRAALARLNAWVRRHQRPAVIAIFALVGAYFTLNGVAELLA